MLKVKRLAWLIGSPCVRDRYLLYGRQRTERSVGLMLSFSAFLSARARKTPQSQISSTNWFARG